MNNKPKTKNQRLKNKTIKSKMGKICGICGKGSVSSYNRPHSLHKTKRVVRPNLQKFQGNLICTRCLRNLTR